MVIFMFRSILISLRNLCNKVFSRHIILSITPKYIFKDIQPTILNDSIFVELRVHQKCIWQDNKIQKHDRYRAGEFTMTTQHYKYDKTNAISWEFHHGSDCGNLGIDMHQSLMFPLHIVGQTQIFGVFWLYLSESYIFNLGTMLNFGDKW